MAFLIFVTSIFTVPAQKAEAFWPVIGSLALRIGGQVGGTVIAEKALDAAITKAGYKPTYDPKISKEMSDMANARYRDVVWSRMSSQQQAQFLDDVKKQQNNPKKIGKGKFAIGATLFSVIAAIAGDVFPDQGQEFEVQDKEAEITKAMLSGEKVYVPYTGDPEVGVSSLVELSWYSLAGQLKTDFIVSRAKTKTGTAYYGHYAPKDGLVDLTYYNNANKDKPDTMFLHFTYVSPTVGDLGKVFEIEPQYIDSLLPLLMKYYPKELVPPPVPQEPVHIPEETKEHLPVYNPPPTNPPVEIQFDNTPEMPEDWFKQLADNPAEVVNPKPEEYGEPAPDEVKPLPEPNPNYDPENPPDTELGALQKLLEMFKDFIEWLKNFLTQIYEDLMGILASILAFLEGIWEILANMNMPDIGSLPDLLKDLFKGLGDLFGDFLQDIGDMIQQIIDWLTITLPDLLTGLFQGLMDLLQTLFNSLLEALQGLLAGLQSLLAQLLDIFNFLNGLIDGLVNSFQGLITDLFVPEAVPELVPLQEEMKTKFPMIPAITGAFDSLGGAGGCSVNDITADLKLPFGLGGSFVIMKMESLLTTFGTVKDWIRGMLWVIFCIYLYRKIPAIIAGRGGAH